MFHNFIFEDHENYRFKYRDFYIPGFSFSSCEGTYVNPWAMATFQSQLSELSNIFFLLRRFDCNDADMDAATIGSLDGEWTELTKKICVDHGFEATELFKITYYRETGPSWTCPVCGRNKYELLGRAKGKGIRTLLHQHHDHIGDIGTRTFKNTVLCQYCNSLDTGLKQRIKPYVTSSWNQCDKDKVIYNQSGENEILSRFSFSPDAMRLALAHEEFDSVSTLSQETIKRAANIYNEFMADGLHQYILRHGQEAHNDECIVDNPGLNLLALRYAIPKKHILSAARHFINGDKATGQRTYNTFDHRFRVFKREENGYSKWASPQGKRYFIAEYLRGIISNHVSECISENIYDFRDFCREHDIEIKVYMGDEFLKFIYVWGGEEYSEDAILFSSKYLFLNNIMDCEMEHRFKFALKLRGNNPMTLDELTPFEE